MKRDSAGAARNLWRLLQLASPKWRRRAVMVTGLMLVGAAGEVLTLGSIVPFLAAMSGGHGLPGVPGLPFELQGVTPGEGLLVLAAVFALLALATGALRVLLIWFSNSFVFGLGHELSVKLFESELGQPYDVQTGRNSADVIGGVNKVQILITDLLMHAVRAAAALVISVAIIAALFVIDPLVAGLAMTGLGSVYCLVTFLARNRLHQNSAAISHAQSARVQTIQEGLGAIRDIILNNLHGPFARKYREIDRKLQRAHLLNVFAAKSPRFVIEAFAMVLIAAIAVFLAGRPGGLAAALPALGALALGGQRLLPLVQEVYQGWAQFRGYGTVLADVLEHVERGLDGRHRAEHQAERPVAFRHTIALEDVSFGYSGRDGAVLRNIGLSLAKGEKVALVGPTGGGKSTLADLIMGLLTPQRGRLLIDGTAIDETTVSGWQRHIAHVPQACFLLDASIAENIALGETSDKIDMERVRRAAEKAQIAGFVEQLPEGYLTRVGEQGIRFSGGQRQRIAIARALYKQASVLVLDEATSALDGQTESAVVDALSRLEGDMTVLLITHRETALRCCDRVIRVDGGTVHEPNGKAVSAGPSPAPAGFGHAATMEGVR